MTSIAAKSGKAAPRFVGGLPKLITKPVRSFTAPSMQGVPASVTFRQVHRGKLVEAAPPPPRAAPQILKRTADRSRRSGRPTVWRR